MARDEITIQKPVIENTDSAGIEVITPQAVTVANGMNYFATKLDVANLKIELMEYSQKQIEMTESKLDKKLDALSKKIDELIKSK